MNDKMFKGFNYTIYRKLKLSSENQHQWEVLWDQGRFFHGALEFFFREAKKYFCDALVLI